MTRVVPNKGTNYNTYRRNFSRYNGSYEYDGDEDLKNSIDFINNEYGYSDDEYDDYGNDQLNDLFDEFCDYVEKRQARQKAVREYQDDRQKNFEPRIHDVGSRPQGNGVLREGSNENGRNE